jgi:two-component system sensor histidine kinase GlrK
MGPYYPKSFLKLVLIGLLLVALPTLIVLISVVVSIEQLTRRGQTAVQQAAHATQTSRRISELITAMERNARQYAILGDQGLLATYESHRQHLTQTTNVLSSLVNDREQSSALERLIGMERDIFTALSDPASPKGKVNEAVSRYVELANLAQTIMARSNDRIDEEIEALRLAGDDVRAMVLWELLALLPAMIVLVVGSTLMVARPIREIDGAIRRMGAGDFSTPISVGGPQDLRYLGRQLDWLRMRMVELEQMRNRFLQHVSHELKTPLTALREGSELLAGGAVGKLSAEQMEIAEILRQHSLHLQRLIEDLLNYAALQFHRLALAPTRVGIKDVIDHAVAGQSVALRTKDLRLDVQCADIMVRADPDKLRVIVDNLLSNAIKFSPVGGEIKITVTSAGEQIFLEVLDSGPGVTMNDKDRVFEPFFRGSAAHESRVKGTGLGLAIVKEYILAHGGSVHVVDPGKCGGHLRVVLPQFRAHDNAIS